jgi:hypothetical protein
MAGFYPDAPDHKMFYQDDGTTWFNQDSSNGVVTAANQNQASNLNGETLANNFYMSATNRVGLIFPQAVDIAGMFLCSNVSASDTSGIVRTSTDTTNGADGAWTTQTSTFPNVTGNEPSAASKWRTAIQTVTYSGIRGLTIAANTGGYVHQLHLYGRPSTGQNPDRLRFWQPSTDAEVTGPHFDYGDLARGASGTVQFRVKNNSATKTASAITVADDALTSASPTLASQTTFSADGSAFSATLSIGDLAPGALSGVLYARLTLTNSAAVGPWRQRFKASAINWA